MNFIGIFIASHCQTLSGDLISELHWPPVQSRLSFKISSLTYKMLSTGQPTCILYFKNVILFIFLNNSVKHQQDFHKIRQVTS